MPKKPEELQKLIADKQQQIRLASSTRDKRIAVKLTKQIIKHNRELMEQDLVRKGDTLENVNSRIAYQTSLLAGARLREDKFSIANAETEIARLKKVKKQLEKMKKEGVLNDNAVDSEQEDD